MSLLLLGARAMALLQAPEDVTGAGDTTVDPGMGLILDPKAPVAMHGDRKNKPCPSLAGQFIGSSLLMHPGDAELRRS